MSVDKFIFELKQPYNCASLIEELRQLKQRIYDQEIQNVQINMNEVYLLNQEEVDCFETSIRTIIMMGRNVVVCGIRPAVASLLVHEFKEGKIYFNWSK